MFVRGVAGFVCAWALVGCNVDQATFYPQCQARTVTAFGDVSFDSSGGPRCPVTSPMITNREVLPAGSATAIACEDDAVCVLKMTGQIECLGQPPPGLPTTTFTQIAIGENDGCGVHMDGALECWGRKLGQTPVPSGVFKQVSVAANAHACAVAADDHVECWGDNAVGQATSPAGSFKKVAAASTYSCGLKLDGAIACWGSTGSLYLGAPHVDAPAPGTYVDLASDGVGMIAVASDGHLVRWNIATERLPEGPFVHAGVSSLGDVCGLTADGTAKCTSAIGTSSERFKEICMAYYPYVCGVRTDGALYCFGDMRGAKF
ncbi:MAG: hypothetical protein IT381_08290 [Deltaproteobacteria bacterium]|nr:hypothetical protein [Deltaproteobacteria bacterium]